MGAPGGDVMAGMAERDLECFLCLRHFAAMYGDLIIAEEIICDDCLAELGQLTESELKQRVSARLAQRNLTSSTLADQVVHYIRRPHLGFRA
jgi:hypothetical protein